MKFCQGKIRCMVLGIATVCVIHGPNLTMASELEFSSETMVRGFERDSNIESNLLVAPIYEFMQIDFGSLSEAGFSLHANGWGRSDVGDGDFFTDEQASELLYGYVEYTSETNNLSTRVGRQYVFDGPSSESIDGIRIQGEIAAFGFSGFAGLPVALDEDDNSSGDSAYGATLRYRLFDFNNIGLSYKQVNSNSDLDEESLGVDVFIALPKAVDFTLTSTRNLISDDWAEHFVEAKVDLGGFGFRPYFQQFQYDDYFSSEDNSANPFRYLAGTDEELTIFAADLINEGDSGLEYGGKIKNYDYSSQDDNSLFVSALAIWHGNEMTQVGAEIGAMTGDQPENEYLLYRLYTYFERESAGVQPGFLSFDLVFVDYKEEIQNESSSLFASIGGGWRLLDDSLEVKLSGDYSADPFFDEDVRGMMVLTYKFSSEEG